MPRPVARRRDRRQFRVSWREFWKAYAQSRGALIGLGLIVVLILLALFAGHRRAAFAE